MKNTQLKDIVRTIRGRFVSWLSIAVIASLAVASFIGVRFSADAIRSNADRYYDETGFRDIEIISTMLLTEDDLHEIAEVEGVSKVVGIRSFDTSITNGDAGCDVTVATLTDEINAPVLISGSYPAGRNECLVEADIADEVGLAAGDMLVIPDTDYLTNTSFRVAGIVSTPNQLAIGSQVAGNRSILVPAEVFSSEAFDDCYTKAEIALAEGKEANMFSNKYLSYANSCRSRLTDLAAERTQIRQQELRDKYQKEIDEKQALLDEAEAQLKDARTQLDENQALIEAGEQELAQRRKELEAADKKLKAAKRTLDDAWRQLTDAKAQLDAAAAELQSAKAQLEDGYRKVLDARDNIRNSLESFLEEYFPAGAGRINWITSRTVNIDNPNLTMKAVPITNNISLDLTMIPKTIIKGFFEGKDFTLDDLIAIYAAIKGIEPEDVGITGDEIIDFLADYVDNYYVNGVSWGDVREQANKWENGHATYLSGLAAYNAALGEYNAKYNEYLRGLAEYRRGLAQYQAGLAAVESGEELLQENKELLAEKEAEYAASLAEYEDGLAQLEDARTQLEKIPLGKWIILNVRGNASYLFLDSLSTSFRKISSTFSMLLVFVAALVIYATIGKIIEEQRNLVGTTKALGLWNSEIFAKYLVFSLTAAFAGYIFGMAFAYFAIERIFLSAQSSFFHLQDVRLLFEPSYALLAAALTFLVCTVAAYLACRRLVRMPAVRLMQGEPPAGVRSGKDARTSGSLYSRLILRNMRSDLKRVAVTIVSVAGCCALMVIGTTVNHAMSSALSIQYNKIYRYDYIIEFDPSENGQTEDEIESVLSSGGTEFISVYYDPVIFQNEDEIDSTSLLSGDPAEISNYFLSADPATGDVLDLSEKGVFLPKKLDETGPFRSDGSITLFGDGMEPFDVSFAGAFDCYIARYLIMSEETYTETFGAAPVRNQYLIRADAANAEQMRGALEGIPGVKSFYASKDRMAQFEGSIGIAKGIVVLLTAVSIVMAFFILLNLINMYITQKKRELTVMRINGFTVGEVKSYVGREMILTSVVGIILGIIIGVVFALRITMLLESINSFDHHLYFAGWAFAVGVTAILSLSISLIALKKVKDLKLTDIA